ncbi:MAG: hypothetical protein ACRDRG_17740 [Pseudonocardiaceae bacterium]
MCIKPGTLQPAVHLDLWLATTNGASFGRLSVGSADSAYGLVNPARRWAGATLYDGGSIAYLARSAGHDEAIGLRDGAHVLRLRRGAVLAVAGVRRRRTDPGAQRRRDPPARLSGPLLSDHPWLLDHNRL